MTNEKYVIGIDVGTTSVKLILISSSGKIIAESAQPHDLISLHPNWAEEKADVWWKNTLAGLKDLYDKCPEELKKVCCIGCSGMVPAIVMLDEYGQPVRNSIQQNDSRALEQIERLTAEIDQARLYALTGGNTNQQHILPRILWVKENEPEVWARVRTILGSYDYIAFRLSGVKSLEINWAVESGAFDIHSRRWLSDMLESYEIPVSLFPKVNDSHAVIGCTMACFEEKYGLPGGIPIIAGSADHVASTLAAGITGEGDLLIKFGGAGDILFCTEELKTNPNLFIDFHDVPGKYLINGCMAASGSLVKWFTRDILNSQDPEILKKLDDDASMLPAASDGLIVLPYFLGEKTPLMDPTARGTLFGLTLSHTKAHIFRAILESVIYGFRHHIEVLSGMGCAPKNIIATNGGAKSRFWCQIAADVLDSEICAYPSHPGSALGVAFLAGMSAGVFTSWEEIRRFLEDRRIFKPRHEAVKVYDRAYEIYRQLYIALRPSCDALQKLYDGGIGYADVSR